MAGRFESMLATAMTLGDQDAGSRAASWRQIVDILAQGGQTLPEAARALALERLAMLRNGVSATDRRLAAASLAGRSDDPAVAALFAADEPGVAAPFLSRLTLADAAWQQLIPTMAPASRNILRNRRDLPLAAVTTLARFAPGDLALPAAHAEGELEPGPGVTQIRDLVERIAAYRERVPAPVVGEPGDTESEVAADAPATGFEFETMADGTIDWVEGAAREALIGLTIGRPADFGAAGVDGQAAGAWRRRAPFRDARLLVGGSGAASGDWLITAAPLFNPRDGRFCGYRGEARRPEPGERAGGASAVDGIAPDSLRQLVHELRTPLNAIQGFAEMIDKQMLGPAALKYRQRARAIMVDAERLVAMVDDLDTSARLDTGRIAEEPPAEPDLALIARTVVGTHRQALALRGVELALRGADEPAPVAAPALTTERMIARLMAAASGIATPGETVAVAIGRSAAGVTCSVSRPNVIEGRDERTLLDPGYGPDGDWPDAPLLGLGFTLRLVARLAAQAGGSLATHPDRFDLTLPAIAERSSDRAC
jgi:signal transduction histidine kinase